MDFNHVSLSTSPNDSGMNPTPNLGPQGKKKNGLQTFFSKFSRNKQSSSFNSASSNGGAAHSSKPGGNIFRFVLTVAIAIGVLLLGFKVLSSVSFSSRADNKTEVKGAIATQDINQEFTFPLKDAQGTQIGALKYMLEQTELRDEIIVKGQRANAIQGRTFVILTIKITNDFTQPVQINTRDYIRLSVNGNTQELLAPDIHNDPVEVQAISTKYTRVGFPINTNDKDLVLWVGEINGEKQQIPVTLQ